MNNSGKILTVFLVIISIILLSLSGITLFFFQKEIELRKVVELNLEQTKTQKAKIQGELEETTKTLFVVEEKLKEADEKINNLLDELELEKGLREESKKENLALREALENESASKEQLRKDLKGQISQAEEKVASVEEEIQAQKKSNEELVTRNKELEKLNKEVNKKVEQLELEIANSADLSVSGDKEEEIPSEKKEPEAAGGVEEEPSALENSDQSAGEVELEKIVVSSDGIPSGKVLTIDGDNEFLILSLGKKDGINEGMLFSLYREKEYLGDVRVSKVQEDMAAADIIPPLSSQEIRKNDQAIAKQ